MNPFRSVSLASRLQPNLSHFMPLNRRRPGRFCCASIGLLAAAFALCAAGASAATLTVNTTADSSDASGSCASGTCSLRDAISQAGAGDTIDFSVSGTVRLGSALPAITQNLTIQGPGADQLTVSGAGNAVFSVTSGASVTFSGMTIANGAGALAVSASSAATVQNCAFTANTATSGGAIDNAGTIQVFSSTFDGNSAHQGGALFNAGGATMTVADDTFAQNSASTSGGAIQNAGALTATNNTFYANSASGGSGGAIFNASGGSVTLTANNNVFASNAATASGAGIYNTSGDTANASYNVYYKNLANGSEDDCHGCTANASATPAAANPLALPLGNYGGPTQTFLPLPGSKAICAGLASLASAASLTLDQRGFAINPSHNPCAAGSVDAGAVQTNYIEVQNNGDAGAGAGDCPGASCTLRDAIALAGSAGDIDFASGITTVNLTNANGGLTLNAATGVEIAGPGANSLTINGNGNSANPLSVFTVNSGTQAMLYGLTVTGGNSTGDGGGVNNSGTLLLAESAVENNVAGGNGGGIGNSGALAALDSTVSGNSAGGNGGGIYNSGAGASASITESTIEGNSAGASSTGGGIYNAGSMAIAGSTIWANSSSNGAGGIFSGGTLTLANSVVANNSGSTGFANINGSFTGSGNVIGGGDSANTADAGGTGAAIAMSSLQLNGASDTVPTLIPLPGGASGNPVICAGSASNIPSGIAADERGYPVENTSYAGYSTASPCVDAGAVQTDYSMSFTSSPTPTTLTVDQGFGAAVTLDENGVPFAESSVSIPVTISSGTLYGSGVVSGTASQSTSAGVATFSGLTASVGSGDTLTSTLSLNASLTTPLSLTASSAPFNVNPASTSTALTSNTGANSSTGAVGSSAVNQSVTFTATVSAPAGGSVPLTGNVTFTDNGSAITNGSSCGTAGVVAVTWSATSATGTATCTTSALAGGSHAIVAAYNRDSSDANYLGSNNYVTESVGLVATTVGTPTVPPGALTVNQTVTVTATVAPTAGGTPTVNFSGTMEFFNNGAAVSNCTAVTVTPTSTGATASCPISGLTASATPYLITAQYKGDSSYSSSSASAALSLTIGQASVNMNLVTSSPGNTSTVNQPVTFTATVTENPTGSIPLAGTVAFTDNGATIAGCSAVTPSLSTGTAACTDTALDAQHSPHTIKAAYGGDPNFANNNQSLTQTVNPAGTTTVVSSSVNPSVLDQQVTFTALVTPAPGSVGLSSTGTVNFTDSATGQSIPGCSAQPITITNGVGKATCITSALAVDNGSTPHTITAAYGNDPNFTTSSGTVMQTVNPVSSTILLSSTGAATVNQPETFTATITVSAVQPLLVGTVAFTDSALPSPGTIPNCSAQAVTQLNSSTWIATCPDSSLTAGSHTITAQYSGDKNLSVGNGTWTQTMNPAQSSILISGGAGIVYVQNPKGFDDTVTFTATVTPTNGVPLSGVVTFNGVPSCQGASSSAPATLPVSPASGQAACTTTTLPSGANTISASYSGDPNYTNASSQPVVQSVSDYSISMVNVPAGASGVQVTQGFTTTAGSSGAPLDPFVPARSVAVSPASIGSYSSSAVTITCTSNAAGAPVCLPGNSTSATLQIAAGNVVQQSVNITIDASGANVAPGTYTFTVTAIDSTTGLTRTTSFPVSIRPAMEGKSALNLVSGATANNSASVSLLLPQSITLSNLTCASVVGTAVSSAEPPGDVGIACSFSPTSLGSSASTGPQTVTTTVTVTTNNAIAAVKPLDIGNRRSLLLAAGFLLPLFGLLGIRRGRRSVGSMLFRTIAIAAIGIAAFQTLGCGGSYHSSSTVVSGGTTPPGTYYLLVQGTGSDGKNYQAVLQVNVNL
jgi:CSLREA domain-containing protein